MTKKLQNKHIVNWGGQFSSNYINNSDCCFYGGIKNIGEILYSFLCFYNDS